MSIAQMMSKVGIETKHQRKLEEGIMFRGTLNVVAKGDQGSVKRNIYLKS